MVFAPRRRLILTAYLLYASFSVLTSTHFFVSQLQKGACLYQIVHTCFAEEQRSAKITERGA